jgi:hypothetical protein
LASPNPSFVRVEMGEVKAESDGEAKLMEKNKLPLVAFIAFLLILPQTSIAQDEKTSIPYYSEVLADYRAKGYQKTKGIKVVIEGENFVAQGKGRAIINQGAGGNRGKSVNWGKNEGEWLEWKFSVPQAGLYNIALNYYPADMEQKDSAFIIRELMMDGRYPFYEMTDIMLSYLWKPSSKEEEKIKRDMEYGDKPPKVRRDIEPNTQYWRTEQLGDWSASALEPFLFYLEAGSHTLRLISKTKSLGLAVSPPQSIELDRILISSPYVPSYKEVSEKYKAEGVKETRDITVKVQGEDYYAQGGPGQITHGSSGAPIRSGVVYVNASSLFIRENAEPEGYYNTLGYWHWPGSWVRWKFSVPEGGLYKIAIKYSQGTTQPVPISLRNLKIDDEFPFEEMEYIKFPTTGGQNEMVYQEIHLSVDVGGTITNTAYAIYRTSLPDGTYVAGLYDTMKWSLRVPSDEQGKPYLFYLAPGEHTLEMKSVVGPELRRAKDILAGVADELVKFLSNVDDVVRVKSAEDLGRTDITKEIPGMVDLLKRQKERLNEVSDVLARFSEGTTPPAIARIDIIKEQIDNVIKTPNIILTKEKLDPNSLYSFRAMTANTIENLVNQLGTLQALDIDYIAVASPNVRINVSQRSFFRTVRRMWVEFIDSFREEPFR